jgi:hypothetical protein
MPASRSTRWDRIACSGRPTSARGTLLFSHQRKLFLLDGVSGNVREVLATPQQNLGSVGLSRDNRTIYYSVAAAESDLCLMTIK